MAVCRCFAAATAAHTALPEELAWTVNAVPPAWWPLAARAGAHLAQKAVCFEALEKHAEALDVAPSRANAGTQNADVSSELYSVENVPLKEEDIHANAVVIASHQAYVGMQRALANATEAQAQHKHLADLTAWKLTSSELEALRSLLHMVSGVETPLRRLSQESRMLGPSEGIHCGTVACDSNMRRLLSGVLRDAGAASAGISLLSAGTHGALRRLWPMRMPGPSRDIALSLVDAWSAPNMLSHQMRRTDPPLTAGECQCAGNSECTVHGRPFPWCIVHESAPCPMRADPPSVDPTGADHHVVGAATGPSLWDYCNDDATNLKAPASVHSEGHCERRDDVLVRYLGDPTYMGKDGQFDWARVPWRDRLALESMIQYAKGQAPLCAHVPSSGHFKVCPVSRNRLSGGDHTADSASAWWRRQSWDFCVVPTRKAEEKEVLNGRDDMQGLLHRPAGAKLVTQAESTTKAAPASPASVMARRVPVSGQEMPAHFIVAPVPTSTALSSLRDAMDQGVWPRPRRAFL